MSTASHAPGPWTAGVAETDLGVQISVCINGKDSDGDNTGFLIAQMPFNAEDWANARLIAAAPDMLAALKQLDICARDGLLDDARRAEFNVAYKIARSAIAKAEGKS